MAKEVVKDVVEAQEPVDTQEQEATEHKEEKTVKLSEMKRRLQKQEEQFNERLNEAVKNAIEKERSYAEMSEKEKKEAQVQEREEALAKREAELAKAELQAEVKTDVLEKGLPTELVDILTVSDDKEAILANVNAIKELVDQAITEGIKANARQKAPSEPTRDYGMSDSQSFADFANKNRLIKN